ncbi:Asp-tRNA(Asn)/Glu-tRNA(Gln) amidotransferase subunit GatA [Planctomicrobium piriforme]|uniref:Glutamyl-tRNA(Gln) amidotransferase subunit A n=1 Tax=Planctomicrobium piriforme TaxID=1576369 RepID=A0A1I3GZW5_9PLAN|nr:Asp-tRNA(Asn)/Glu-tRNA(Gln) amidotransferase subunit GatA [Planctomicrobium piriforme]SFI29118.1 aspartyl-tRNA(Asn)/glutamyl-tRNA(Gln) amidotransferase subunit A [Planctomicrobium piriforme]
MSLSGFSALELMERQRRGEATAVQIVTDHLAVVRQREPQLGAFLEVDDIGALKAAEAVDRKRASGVPLGRLAGIPIAVKDNLCVQGWKTTCASRMLESFAPPYDAHVVARLKAEDAILMGRTNLDEFAMGSSCENSAFQQTKNPWNTECAPGGSSGGSAAAVAAGMSPVSLGSDTGGSIRQPAAFCGIVGLKPTYGRVSRYGLVAFASSLDQIGPFGRNIADAALLTQVIAGHDPRDSTSVNTPLPDLLAELEQPLQGLRIGIVPEHLGAGVDLDVANAVTEALAVYRQLGATIVDIELPYARYGVAAYYVIAPCEASSNLARYDGVHYGHRAGKFGNLVEMYEASRGEGFGDEVKRRIMIGTYALSSGYYDAYYLKAMKVRRLIANDFADAFKQVDVVLTPTSPTPAFRIGELSADPLQMYLNDIYTIGANLAGIPALSLPCGLSSKGLPIGLQLLAPAFEESRLLRAARMFEKATDWHQQRPPAAV